MLVASSADVTDEEFGWRFGLWWCPGSTPSCLRPLANSEEIGHFLCQFKRNNLPILQGEHRHPGQDLPIGVKKQMREKTRRKGWMIEQEAGVLCLAWAQTLGAAEGSLLCSEKDLGMFPWCWKRLLLEFSPFRHGFLSTASNEMTRRFLCPLGSLAHATQQWAVPSPLWCCSRNTHTGMLRSGLLVPQPSRPLIHSFCLLPVLAKGKAEESTGRGGDSFSKPRWLS